MFITFEGSDGSGKTTQVKELADFLRAAGYEVLLTREPGGTPIGEQVRAVLFNPKNDQMHLRTEILLFQAARAQLVEQIIRPRLASGNIVISDRYADSTLAYQGYGYDRPVEPLRAIVTFATANLKPDLTIFLDVDVEAGLRRRARDGDVNRLDAQDLAFYQRVRQGYLQLIQEEPSRWASIDANRSAGVIQAEVRRVVQERLKLRT